MTWTGGFAVLIGVGILGVAAFNMSKFQDDKDSFDYQAGVAGLFSALICVLCGILMLKTGLGTRLFTSPPTTAGMGGMGGMGMGGMGMGGYGGGYGGGMW